MTDWMMCLGILAMACAPLWLQLLLLVPKIKGVFFGALDKLIPVD